jgi:pimeloyl-ACP methyl ester carboxylesterase
LLPVAHTQFLQRALPNARIERYEKCGHCPQIECAERFNRDVTAFVRGLS